MNAPMLPLTEGLDELDELKCGIGQFGWPYNP
jgi:hypothetical protein